MSPQTNAGRHVCDCDEPEAHAAAAPLDVRDRIAEFLLSESLDEWAAKVDEVPKEAYKFADAILAAYAEAVKGGGKP